METLGIIALAIMAGVFASLIADDIRNPVPLPDEEETI